MSTQNQIYELYESVEPDYPRLLPSDRRNKDVDFAALGRYAEGGTSAADVTFSLFVRAKGRVDAVWIAGIAGPIVSRPLREALEGVAGRDLDFLPVAVNDEPYWIMRVSNLVDALEPDHTTFEMSRRGTILAIRDPVWISSRVRDPQVFIVPQQPFVIWATQTVVDTYEVSGCNGLVFGARGHVI